MKKVSFTLLLCTFFLLATSQTKYNFDTSKLQRIDAIYEISEDSVKDLLSEIILSTKAPYKFNHREQHGEHVVLYGYSLPDTSTLMKEKQLTIIFTLRKVRENKALEIKGEEKYLFSEMTSNFLNVFPFWKKYIDPNADINELSKQGARKKVYLKSNKSGAIVFEATIRESFGLYRVILQ